MDIQKKPALNIPINETFNVLDQSEPQNGIEVICRIRPAFNGEKYVNYTIEDKKLDIYEYSSNNEIQNQKTFTFSHLYDQNATQRDLHHEYVIPIIRDLFEKKRGGLVFTYGVTNSGKTYTIIGNTECPGVLPLTLQSLDKVKTAFLMNKQTADIDGIQIQIRDSPYDGYVLKDLNYTFQSLEIYNEEIYDLLNQQKNKLQLKEIFDRKCYVKDAIEKTIENNQDFKETLNKALSNRQMGETTLNVSSSRSHTIFRIQVTFKFSKGAHIMQKICNVCVVDLAGSERAKKAETQGSQLTEACNINKSLLVLGKCLKQMRCQNESDLNNRIPFRECKLTRLLCEYFTEDNRILMIVNVKLTKDDIEETYKVLHYGALSVNVNLLKSKVYDATASYNQKLGQSTINLQKNQNIYRRNQQECFKRAKMLIQNNTNNMLFQQSIQDSFIKDLLSTIKVQESKLKQIANFDDELLLLYPPIFESEQRLQKSLERIQSEKRLSRQASLEIQKQSTHNTSIPQVSTFYEELPQRQSYEQQLEEGKSNEHHSIISEIIDDSNNQLQQNETDELLNGLKQLDLEQIDELSDDSKFHQQCDIINENQIKFDQATNTTPYDEMKKKLFGNLLDLELQTHQENRENFKKEVMKKLFDDDDLQDLLEKENQQEQINLNDSAKKQQQKNIEKLISSNHKSALKIINESDQEQDSSGGKKHKEQPQPKVLPKKKHNKKKGKSKRR